MSFIESVEHRDHPIKTTDHRIVEVKWCYSRFVRGPGNTRCPPELLRSAEYAELIRNTVRETVISHLDENACTAEQLALLDDESMSNLPSTASPDILLEVVLGQCRDETNRFVTLRNRTRNRRRKDLETAVLRARLNYYSRTTEKNGRALDAAQTDMDIFLDAEEKSKQQHLRAKWITQGDRPSAWYLNLARARASANSIP